MGGLTEAQLAEELGPSHSLPEVLDVFKMPALALEAAVIVCHRMLSAPPSASARAVVFLQFQALKEARATIAWWQQRQAKLSQKLSQRKNKLVSSALQKLPLKATQARR